MDHRRHPHLTRLDKLRRADAQARQALARSDLTGLNLTAHPTSYFTWLRLDPHLHMDQVATALAQVGILVSTADAFATDKHPPHALRLALTGPAIDNLTPILTRLRATLDTFPP